MQLGRSEFLLTIALAATPSCAPPAPKAPETVTRQAAAQPRSPLIVKLNLSPSTSEEVEALFLEVRAFLAQYEKARVALIDEAVSQIGSGALDRGRLEPLAMKAIAEWEAALPRLANAANCLHALLTPKERLELIQIMEGKENNLTEEEKRRAREERVSKLLDLSSTQKTRLFGQLLALTVSHYTLVTNTREAISEAKEAFIADDYDARKLKVVTSLDLHAVAELAFEAIVGGMEVLTPPQHRTLAAILQARLLPRTTDSAHPGVDNVDREEIETEDSDSTPPELNEESQELSPSIESQETPPPESEKGRQP